MKLKVLPVPPILRMYCYEYSLGESGHGMDYQG